MGKLIPILLAVIGLAAGIGGGLALRPAPEPQEAPEEIEAEVDPAEAPEYVKLNNQFVVPLMEEGRVRSMVILSLSLEVTAGSAEKTYSREPKLRDSLLQVMFDHANAGGFAGSFTDGANLVLLRKALLEAAQTTLPDTITDVLISDIVRQDS